MDIQTFSQMYWYVWLLVSLLIVILLVINFGGICQYSKKRRQYLDDLQRKTPMKLETRENHRPKSIIAGSTVAPSSTVIDEKKAVETIHFDLEIFRRQALKEHNRTRAMNQLLPLKLSETLNIQAQDWADQCAQSKMIRSSDPNWRLSRHGKPLGERIVSTKLKKTFDGRDLTRMIVAETDEESCLLNSQCTDVGFGCARYSLLDGSQQWIAVVHYSPYHQ